MKQETDNEFLIWDILKSDQETKKDISELIEIGHLIWCRGWAEANAGNISIRIPQEFVNKHASTFKTICKQELNCSQSVSSFKWYLVSASGSRFRQYKTLEFGNFIIIAEDMSSHIQIMFPSQREPTSEWPTHNICQNWLEVNNKPEKVILHVHLTNWIILSGIKQYKENKPELVNRVISLLPELEFCFPNKFCLLPKMTPGSVELAESTLNALKDYNSIIWEKHGVIVAAESVEKAFDMVELLAKAADIFLYVNQLEHQI